MFVEVTLTIASGFLCYFGSHGSKKDTFYNRSRHRHEGSERIVTRKGVARDNVNEEVKPELSPQRQVGVNFAGEEEWDGALQCVQVQKGLVWLDHSLEARSDGNEPGILKGPNLLWNGAELREQSNYWRTQCAQNLYHKQTGKMKGK